jgi:hypothetical protein
LAALGHKGELNRNFSPMAMLGLHLLFSTLGLPLQQVFRSLCQVEAQHKCCGGWEVSQLESSTWLLSLTLSVAAGLCNLCLAVSLAEFLLAYLTAGVSVFSAPRLSHLDDSQDFSTLKTRLQSEKLVKILCRLPHSLLVRLCSFRD